MKPFSDSPVESSVAMKDIEADGWAVTAIARREITS